MTTPKPQALRVGTIVWALLIVAFLTLTATGVVTLFGSKFGPGFPVSADALSGDDKPAPRLQRRPAPTVDAGRP